MRYYMGRTALKTKLTKVLSRIHIITFAIEDGVHLNRSLSQKIPCDATAMLPAPALSNDGDDYFKLQPLPTI